MDEDLYKGELEDAPVGARVSLNVEGVDKVYMVIENGPDGLRLRVED